MSTIYVPDALQTWGLSLKTTWHVGTTIHIYRVGSCSCNMWTSTRLRSNGTAIRTQIGLFSEFPFQSVSLLVLSAIEECWSLRVRGLCSCFSAWLTAGHRACEDEETFTGAHSLIEWTGMRTKVNNARWYALEINTRWDGNVAQEAFVGGSVTEKVGNSAGSWRRSAGIRWGAGAGTGGIFQYWKSRQRTDPKTSWMPCEGDQIFFFF